MQNRLRRFVTCVAFVAGAVLLPSQARADAIGVTGSINFTGLVHGDTIASTLTVGTTTLVRNGLAGEIGWYWENATPQGFTQNFYAYCVDLANYLHDPQTVTVASSTGFSNDPSSPNGGTMAAWLFNTYAAGIHNNTNTAQANNQAAALQVAIWEVMYDSPFSGGWMTDWFNTGDFRMSTVGVQGQATSYLSALAAAGFGAGATAYVLDAKAGLGQDQITWKVSEPSSLLLIGPGMFLFARIARRRKVTQLN